MWKAGEVGMIKIDMPMPDNCLECRFNISEFGYCNAMPVEFVGQVNDFQEDGKPGWCPLKAQEPRLVTESDFNGADEYGYIPVWTEEKDGDMYWECIPKVAITDPDGIEVLRYWTSRPTDEQREAEPWN